MPAPCPTCTALTCTACLPCLAQPLARRRRLQHWHSAGRHTCAPPPPLRAPAACVPPPLGVLPLPQQCSQVCCQLLQLLEHGGALGVLAQQRFCLPGACGRGAACAQRAAALSCALNHTHRCRRGAALASCTRPSSRQASPNCDVNANTCSAAASEADTSALERRQQLADGRHLAPGARWWANEQALGQQRRRRRPLVTAAAAAAGGSGRGGGGQWRRCSQLRGHPTCTHTVHKLSGPRLSIDWR